MGKNCRISFITMIILVLYALLTGCGIGKEDQTATAVAEPQVVVAASEAAASTDAVKATQVQATAEASQAQATAAQITVLAATNAARATLDAQAVLDAQATMDTQATMDAAVRSTETTIAEVTSTAEAFVTETAISGNTTATARIYTRQTATQGAVLQRTAQAQPLYDLVQNLYDDDVITKNQGEFHKLSDFDESWAQRGWYMYFPTGYHPPDFVIDADTWWEAADAYAEGSGCGIVFRESKEGNDQYMIFYSIEGYVVLLRYKNGNFSRLTTKLYDLEYVVERSAHITLVVEGDWITYYIDGEQALRWYDTALTSGNLHLTLVSGTNKDFGTHCKMTNIGLWVLK